jgi:hypothetical protein
MAIFLHRLKRSSMIWLMLFQQARSRLTEEGIRVRPILQLIVVVVTLGFVGCESGTLIGVMFAPPPGSISPGERAEAEITVRFGSKDDSWAGRKVKVAVQSPSDVSVDPDESEVTLDANGSAHVRVYITPDKAAVAGPRTLAITATGSDTANST